MKNKEKYNLNDLEIEFDYDCSNILLNGEVVASFGDDYKFVKEFIEWLEQEYKEPIKLTEDEKAILKNIDKRYTYIARDKNKNLCVYSEKPFKKEYEWGITLYGNYTGLKAFNHLFEFTTWEDEEPYLIEDLLNED